MQTCSAGTSFGSSLGLLLLASCGGESVVKVMPVPDEQNHAALTSAGVAAPVLTASQKADAMRAAVISPADSQVCNLWSAGRTMMQAVRIPANGSITCTTVGKTSLDTVLAIMNTSNYNAYRDPCGQSYTERVWWELQGFNDDSAGTNQSTVSATNNQPFDRDYLLLGFLYSGGSSGSANVTCTTSKGVTTTYSGNFKSGSCRALVQGYSAVYTNSNGNDPTLMAIWPSHPANNNNTLSNDDFNGSTSESRLEGLTAESGGTYYWFLDLGCWGSFPSGGRQVSLMRP